MRYQVILDSLGYCMIIQRTNNPALDIHELDLTKYDLTDDRLLAYKLGKDELIFDENHYKEVKSAKEKAEDIKEMDSLQVLLNNSDYIMSQTVENLLDCTSIVQFLKVFADIKNKYSARIVSRKAWRKRVQEIKEKWGI